MAMANIVQIEKLEGRENFATWKFAIRALLESEDLWGCIEEIPEYVADSKKMSKARAKIILSLDKRNYSHVQETTTPKAAWNKLVETFEDRGLTRKVGLLKSLTSAKLSECKSVEEYVNKVTNAAHQLKEIGFSIEEEMIGALLLSGLPDEYKPMIMGLENSGIAITGNAIKVKLLQEVKSAKEIKTENDETALYLKNKGFNVRDKQRKCFTCGKSGHFAAKCRAKYKPKRNEEQNVQSKTFLTLATGDQIKGTGWYLDSCASSHMTRRLDWMKDAETCNTSVQAANNQKIDVLKKGEVIISVTNGKNKENIVAKEVLYVPELAANLLSVSKITEKGYKVTFRKEDCAILDRKGNIVAKGRRRDGVYQLENLEQAMVATTEDHHLWHRRLGHLNRKGMTLLKKKQESGLGDMTISEQRCKSCALGKHSKLPFEYKHKRANNVLDLIHSDLCGPMSVNSINGARYFLTFIDDHSRKMYVYFLKSKSEVLNFFKMFKAFVERQTGRKIKAIRTDNGREYINSDFKELIRSEGIRHQTTVPYNPQQNGLAERANRTIVERARTMLLDAGLDKKYWAEATSTAVYLINRSPSKPLYGKSPEEVWHGRQPKLQHLKIFGSIAMAYIPKEKRDKWDAKSKQLLFVGYNEDIKGYRLMDPHSHKIINSRDVIFLENQFLKDIHKKKPKTQITITDESDDESKDDEPPRRIKYTEEEFEEEEFLESSDRMSAEEASASTDESGLRRSNRKWKPVIREGYVSYLTVEENNKDPTTIEEALKSHDRDHWIHAIDQELKSLKANDTWEIVNKPAETTILNAKWVFKKKKTENEETRYKARLVIQGYAQTKGINYEETFAPVAKYSSIRYLFALAAQKGLKMMHLDVETAYLNGELMESIYINPPEGLKMNISNDKILKLKKAVYGLKQSGRTWNIKLDTTLKNFGMERLKSDPCIYIRSSQEKMLIIAIYVDDILVLYEDDQTGINIKKKLMKKFKIRDLGEPQEFLGIQIERKNRNEISIHQKAYIKRMLEKFKMNECSTAKSPMESNAKTELSLKKEDSNEPKMENVPYLEAVGSLLYISQVSRPDLAYAVNTVSSYCKNPKWHHWQAVKRIMRYLKGTMDLKLTYSKSSHTITTGFSDADWANDTIDRKSITGCIFMLSGAPISWFSRKQRTVALSTVEAEYIALSFACQEAIWFREFSKELEKENNSEAITIKCDSNGAICLAKNQVTSQRTKHIDVRHHFVRENVEKKIINIEYLATEDMLADMFTKPLGSSKLQVFRDKIGLK